jgi:hypothetical protein
MQIKITKGGIYGNDGKEFPIGHEMTVKEEPKGWAGRYEIIGGAKKGGEPKKLVTGDTGDRAKVFADAVAKLKKEDFTADGKPEVVAINRLLPDGVQAFSAAERDDLWKPAA